MTLEELQTTLESRGYRAMLRIGKHDDQTLGSKYVCWLYPAHSGLEFYGRSEVSIDIAVAAALNEFTIQKGIE